MYTNRATRPPTPAIQRRDAGMSLLEVMIAAAVTTLAFLVTMGSVVSIASTNASSEDQAIAAAVASSVLEEIRGLPIEELAAYTPPVSAEPSGRVAVTVTCTDAAGTAHALPMTDAEALDGFPNPLQVQVNLLWRDKDGRAYTMRQTTWIAR